MAKTSGYVIPSDFGYNGTETIPDATPFYSGEFEAILLCPYMIKQWMAFKKITWASSLVRKHQFDVDWFCADGGVDNVEFKFIGEGSTSNTVTSASGAGWGLGVMPLTLPIDEYPAGKTVSGYPPTYHKSPTYTVLALAYMKYNATAPKVFTIYAEPDGYEAINNVGNEVDNTERTTEANKPYTVNRPLSAWQVSNFISLVDRLMYEARYIANIPAIDSPSVA